MSSPAALGTAIGAGLAAGLWRRRGGPTPEQSLRRWPAQLWALARPFVMSLLTRYLMASNVYTAAAGAEQRREPAE